MSWSRGDLHVRNRLGAEYVVRKVQKKDTGLDQQARIFYQFRELNLSICGGLPAGKRVDSGKEQR
jgi:hypothetical protein